MADTVDMSLDDIIKQQRKNNRANKSKPNSNNNRAQAVRSKIKPKLQRRQVTNKTSPNKDGAEQMLHISNLHFGVSNKDLKQLFEDIGPLKKATVHYDKSGRSLGTAEVTFFSREAAVRAIKKYDQRHLDGRPMNIKLVPSKPVPGMGIKSGGIQKRSPQKTGTGRRPQQGQVKRDGVKKNNPNRKGGKFGKPKQEITAAQLDADLESYKDEKMAID